MIGWIAALVLAQTIVQPATEGSSDTLMTADEYVAVEQVATPSKESWDSRNQAYRTWWNCSADAAEQFSKQRDPAGDVADAALSLCDSKLRLFYFAAKDTDFVNDEGAFVARWNGIARPQLMAIIMSYRVR